MPSFDHEVSVQSLVDGLFSPELETRLLCVRSIKNSIIGSKAKKSSFMLMGVIPRLVSLVTDVQSSRELVCETVITIGSFAHGTPENIQAVLTSNVVPVLLKGVCQSDAELVSACIKTLRTLYLSGSAPASLVFEDSQVVKQLIALLSSSPLTAQCSALILSRATQTLEHQNALCSIGAVEALASCVQSSLPKLVHAALLCLSSLVYENKLASNVVSQAAVCDGDTMPSVITRVLSCVQCYETKFAAAQCLSYLCRTGSINYDSSVITLKVLPALVRLCKRGSDLKLKAQSAVTLAYLTEDCMELQEQAAQSDRLIPSLVASLEDRPDETSDLVGHRHFQLYDEMREGAFLALSSLSSTREDIRIKVISERVVMGHIKSGLNGDNVEVKIAAARCLRSLSRSTKLLRTAIFDAEVWKPINEMLCLRDEQCLVVATSVACNLLLSFSPSREKLLMKDVIRSISNLVSHENKNIRLNAVWALMSLAYESNREVKAQIKSTLGMSRLFELMCPDVEQSVLMKALGLTVNLVQESDEADSVMGECGRVLLNSLTAILQSSPSQDLIEQVLCVLVNISSASPTVIDMIANHEHLDTVLAEILRGEHHSIGNLMACCTVVKNMADPAVEGHVHRQNMMEDAGIKIAVQKLEKTSNPSLQATVKETLDHFSSLDLTL